MWTRGDPDDGHESSKTGSNSGGSPGWVGSHESTWHSKQPSIFRRRHSSVSDSGDTGIGTYCSDGVEDDSSSSTAPSSLRPLSISGQEDAFGNSIPVVHVKPSPSTTSYVNLKRTASSSSSGHLSRSCQVLPPASSPLSAPGSVDMKDQQPIRRWSSLTKLSCGAEKSSSRTSVHQRNTDLHGSLDRGLLSGYKKEPRSLNGDLYLPLTSSLLCHSLLQRSPGAGPCNWNKHGSKSTGFETDLSQSSTLSSPVKRSSLGGGQINCLDLPKRLESPLGHQVDRDSPIQPAVRTQMWLAEQMEYSSKSEHGGELSQLAGTGTKVCGGEGLSPWQGQTLEPGLQDQMLQGTSHIINTLVKVKEGMLRQRELEIDRQNQQILQLHARIRENELRAQQVLHSQRWFEDPQILKMKESVKEMPTERLDCHEDLSRKMAVAELEVLHLNELYKQATQKYTEDLRKLEEKIKTRDRYISSLKKKCQREREQNQEKQQRIETLEKYLADLPTLDEVQVQSLQLEQVHKKAEDLEKNMSRLQQDLDDCSGLLKDKDVKIKTQDRRETELIASVHSLQQKVQQCLEDGVRLPMMDLKQLEEENTELLGKQDHSSKLIEHQKGQILRLNSHIKAVSARLHKGRIPSLLCSSENQESPSIESLALSQQPQVDNELSHVEMSQVGRLLKEMSQCLLDLQALCNILAQRAQGKELNLSLLLRMTSFNIPAEDSKSVDVQEEEAKLKVTEVGQLRKGVDELRNNIADCYAHFVVTSKTSK
ncbi:centrosomal protein of 85 kDa-like isoform X2 [Nerophis lumbriciformis]|uniref:centrosomal protein of 85 kDa-like isoform X2 n=1 Tax=Nerophis lumbriciformis TaxID=546530 RepID=UPI002AE0A9E7|nr:centrosomal protein of 85 kDa-like isoform X2 [Nerophis lumbriciformis]